MLNPIEGEVFYIDKPLHWTSFEAVKKVRARLRRRQALKTSRWAMPARSIRLHRGY